MEKKIIGRCPLCGGNVVKTCKGYRCENNIAEQPSCVLNINGIIGNRKMSDEEITELLEHRFILRHLAQHRWPPAEPDGSQRNL